MGFAVLVRKLAVQRQSANARFQAAACAFWHNARGQGNVQAGTSPMSPPSRSSLTFRDAPAARQTGPAPAWDQRSGRCPVKQAGDSRAGPLRPRAPTFRCGHHSPLAL
eukprot:2910023-Rhodomonas_salina.4